MTIEETRHRATPPNSAQDREHTRRAALTAAGARLAPGFRARALEAERRRSVPASSVRELVDATLNRAYLPRRLGGHALQMRDAMPAVEEVAKGCGSTAWVLAVLQIHGWLASLFDDDALDEVFGKTPDALVAGALQPRGRLVRDGGGFRLGGGPWPFGSGCDHGSWALVGAMAEATTGATTGATGGATGGEPEPVMVLLAPGQWSVHDDWFVSGLKATGSKSIVADGATVPAHRVLSFRDALSGASPGARTAPDAVGRAPFVPMLTLNVTAPAVGVAAAALDDFKTYAKDRMIVFSGEIQGEAGETHIQIGQARIKTDAARLVLHDSARRVADAAAQGGAMALEDRARVRLEAAWAVRQCVEAVETLSLASGGGALQETHPIQRALRDVHAMAAHAILPFETNLKLYGRVAMGLDLKTPFV